MRAPRRVQFSDVVTVRNIDSEHSVFADRLGNLAPASSASELPAQDYPLPQRHLPRVVPFHERPRRKLPLELAIGHGKKPSDPSFFYPIPLAIDSNGNQYNPDSPRLSDEIYSYKDDVVAGSEITEPMLRLSLNDKGYESSGGDECTCDCDRRGERMQAMVASQPAGRNHMDWTSFAEGSWMCPQNGLPAFVDKDKSAMMQRAAPIIPDMRPQQMHLDTDELTPERFCAWLEWFIRPPFPRQQDWRPIADMFATYCNLLDSALWRPEHLQFANVRNRMNIDIEVDPDAMEIDDGHPNHAAIAAKHFGDANDTTLCETDIWAILVSDAYRDLRNMYTMSVETPRFQDEPVFQRARRGFRQLNRMLVTALPAECRLLSWTVLP